MCVGKDVPRLPYVRVSVFSKSKISSGRERSRVGQRGESCGQARIGRLVLLGAAVHTSHREATRSAEPAPTFVADVVARF